MTKKRIAIDMDDVMAATGKKILKTYNHIIGTSFTEQHFENKAYFEQVISQNVGAPVKIGEIKATWSVLWPSFSIKDISITSKHNPHQELLRIPEVALS